MNKLLTSAAVLDCEISEIRLILERHAGVLLDKSSEVLGNQVAEFLESRSIQSSEELIGILRTHPAACDALLDCCLPGDTGFFRHPAALDALEKKVLPEIAARKAADSARSLRIWSAGCSTGEEPYSIAMSVCEALKGEAGWSIHIVATDLRASGLEAAERGVYTREEVASVPHRLMPEYFTRISDEFLVKPRVRNLVTFAPMNLAQTSFIGKFDCIFCMDVLPHFSMSQRIALVERLHLYLEPGGALFLGQNEKLPATNVSFLPQSHLASTYYQRPMAKAAKSGRG